MLEMRGVILLLLLLPTLCTGYASYVKCDASLTSGHMMNWPISRTTGARAFLVKDGMSVCVQVYEPRLQTAAHSDAAADDACLSLSFPHPPVPPPGSPSPLINLSNYI